MLAGLLVEAGVTFVKVNSYGWDTHGDNFNGHLSLVPQFDRPFAALIEDLADRKMLDDVLASTPTDAKGQDLVPQWAADYRTYIADRRLFTESLRESGENLPFYETQVGGIPISEKLEVFAADNRMPTCAPPRDLTR